MKNFKLVLVALMGILMMTTSCSKDDDENTPSPVDGLKTGDLILSRATEYGEDWIYFSFEEGEVEINDQESSLDWDIAFNRYNVRTNSGTSGNGQGGVYDAGAVDFTSVLAANESGYIVDDSIQILESISNMGPTFITTTGSDVFIGCVVRINQTGSYETNNHIYVVKTAQGKYAKVWIKGYYSANSEPGFINMKYAYQSGDGMNLE